MLRFVILNICSKLYQWRGGGVEHTIMTFEGDTEVMGTVNMHEGRMAIQRDLESLEEWSDREFNKDKCKVLKWGRKGPCSGTGWGLTGWGAALQKRIWVSRQRASCEWATSVPWQQRRPKVSSAVLKEKPGGWRKWFFCITCQSLDQDQDHFIQFWAPSTGQMSTNWRKFTGVTKMFRSRNTFSVRRN